MKSSEYSKLVDNGYQPVARNHKKTSVVGRTARKAHVCSLGEQCFEGGAISAGSDYTEVAPRDFGGVGLIKRYHFRCCQSLGFLETTSECGGRKAAVAAVKKGLNGK